MELPSKAGARAFFGCDFLGTRGTGHLSSSIVRTDAFKVLPIADFLTGLHRGEVF